MLVIVGASEWRVFPSVLVHSLTLVATTWRSQLPGWLESGRSVGFVVSMDMAAERKNEPVSVRPAGPADLELLRNWDEQAHVIASDPNDDWNWEVELHRRPEWREQLIAEVDGRPVGFVQIIDPAREESRYWGDAPSGLRAVDIWIGNAADLGRGYGTRIMHLVIDRCFADPAVSAVLIDPLASNVRAHRFYERLGFRFVERRHFGADDCFVYRLVRYDWDAWPRLGRTELTADAR